VHDLLAALRHRPWIPVLLLFTAAMFLYCTHWYPGPGGRVWYGDSVSFQFYAISHSLGHPPGYPQYLALIRAIALAPLGQAWQRVDFASSLFAAAALCSYGWLARVWRVSRLGVWGAIATLALSRTFFLQATEAEVYSLNSFWVLSCLALISMQLRTGDSKWLWGFFAAYGCALGHHPTMVLLVLPVFVTIVVHRPQLLKRWQTYVGACLAIVLGLSQYVYTYKLFVAPDLSYRFASYSQYDLQSFIEFTTGAGYKKLMFSRPLVDVWTDKLPNLLRIAHAQNTLLLALLGILGLVLARARSSAHRTLQLLTMTAYAIWALGYDVSDIDAFCTPLWALCYIDVVAGAHALFLRRVPTSVALLLVFVLNTVGFRDAVIARGDYHPHNRLLAIADEQLAHVPAGASLLVAGKYEGNSALAALFRYLEASRDRGPLRTLSKVKACEPDIYFTDSAKKQIRFRRYRSERVAHLPLTKEDLHRLLCD